MHLPTADRVARLVLPGREEIAAEPGRDWAYAEWHSGPAEGSTRRLVLESPVVGRTTVTVRMSEATRASASVVVPLRLDGLRVGPLQTLAGPHDIDDIYVRIEGEVRSEEGGDTDVISSVPVRVPAPYVCLCRVVSRPGEDLLGVEYHGGSRTGTLSVRTTPALGGLISLDDMVGREWYLYSEAAGGGRHTVTAIEPREVLRAGPPTAVFPGDMKSFLRRHNWSNTGQLALAGDRTEPDPREGDVALVLHVFGGQSYNPVLVSGHFAFGTATVVRCPISGDLRYDLVYHQVYAHNRKGIVSCSQTWAAYRGDIKTGWHSHMPVSDALVTAPELLVCGGQPLRILRDQLETAMARYRSGDGTGISSVTPSTSCVQDSTQAVFLALIRGRYQITDPACRRHLGALSARVEAFLGSRIRPDWQHNSLVLEGTDFKKRWRYGILSWKTMFPRSAFDRYCRVFEGYPVLFVRDDGLVRSHPPGNPSAPTALFGDVPYMSEATRRPVMAGVAPPGYWTVAALAAAALALRVLEGKGLLTVLLTVFLVPHPEDNESPSWPFAAAACAVLAYLTRSFSESALPAVYLLDGSVLSLLLSLGVLGGVERVLRPSATR